MGLAGGLSLGGANVARADLEVSAGVSITATADFDAPLTRCGSWVEVGSYGRCWRPAGVVVGWRPYCDGHWEWTDCGWYWVSDEPWAWACYHYGYWAYDSFYGWVWIPGIEWGPAWVSWRVGGGYIGWAPLAPRHVTVVSANFVFVQDRRFCERVKPSTVIVNNTTIINKTTVVGGTRRETRAFGDSGKRSVVINDGPSVGTVEKASGRKLKMASVQEIDRRTSVPAEVRAKGKPVERKDAGPAKSSVSRPNAKPETAPAKGFEPPRKSSAPEAGKQRPPVREREVIRPSAPESDKGSQPHGRKLPGIDERPGTGGVAPQLPQQRPQGPPSGPPVERGHGKGRGDKDKDKHGKD